MSDLLITTTEEIQSIEVSQAIVISDNGEEQTLN